MSYKSWKRILISNILIGVINLSWYIFILIMTFRGWGFDNSDAHALHWLINILWPILIGCGILIIFNISVGIATLKIIHHLFRYKHKTTKIIILILLGIINWLNIYTLNIVNISIIIYFKCKHRIDKKMIKNSLIIENMTKTMKNPPIKHARRTAYKVKLMRRLLSWSWRNYG